MTMKRVHVGGDTVKVYASRNSAVNRLRELGVKPADYDHFITLTATGQVACELGRAQFHIDQQRKRAEKARKTTRKTRARAGVTSMAEFVRGLILKGEDNAAVWKKMQRRFELPDDKRWYPAWYRGDMRRKGLLPEARA